MEKITKTFSVNTEEGIFEAEAFKEELESQCLNVKVRHFGIGKVRITGEQH